MDDHSQQLSIVAGEGRDGRPAYEEVLVEHLGANRYRLLRSPALALGAAAGDEIDVDQAGRFEVARRGGNVCVQWYAPPGEEACESYLDAAIEELGGRVDGRAGRLIVLTVPVTAGFPVLEHLLEDGVSRFPGSEWYYGNVYDPIDGVTPLRWW